MTALVIGGSGSGKSEYAETLIMEAKADRNIYVATMKPWDEECEKRIERHRRLRSFKGFETIEQYRELKALDLKKRLGEKTAVLLECMSNLVSNELFGLEEGQEPLALDLKCSIVEEQIMAGIEHLKAQADDLVLVTNEVFSDGDSYSPETNLYRKLLGRLNQRMAEAAEQVTEVVAGIPMMLKQTGDES